MIILFCAACILFLFPGEALAWGPLTHIHLGRELLAQAAEVIPPAVYAVLRAYPKDFLYGTIIADVVVGKRFQEPTGESHSWRLVRVLLELSQSKAHRAFAYGYQAHLAADTVAHNEYIPRFVWLPNLTHTVLEMRADGLVDRRVWQKPDRVVQLRNDLLLERALEKTPLTFSTNKRLFQGMLSLTRFHHGRPFTRIINKHLPYQVPEEDIRYYWQKSLFHIIESLSEGEHAPSRREDPSGWRMRSRGTAFAGR